jgi:hypothetical protein
MHNARFIRIFHRLEESAFGFREASFEDWPEMLVEFW